MSNHVFWLGIGLALVALAFAATDRALRIPRDTWRWVSARRIREGMTRADVVRALGPPGNSRKWPLDRDRKAQHLIEVRIIRWLQVHSKEEVETWEFDGGTLVVIFSGGTDWVRSAQLLPDPPDPAPAFERLRGWLGW